MPDAAKSAVICLPWLFDKLTSSMFHTYDEPCICSAALNVTVPIFGLSESIALSDNPSLITGGGGVMLFLLLVFS